MSGDVLPAPSRWAVGVAGLVLGVGAALAVVTGAAGPAWLRVAAAVATVAATWSCLAVAVLTARDVLTPRVRLLLVWLAVAWSVGTVAYLDVPSPVAAPLGSLWLAALAHLVLALPDGRLRGRWSGRLVVVAYVVAAPASMLLVVLPSVAGDVAAVVSAAVRPALGLALVVLLLRRSLTRDTVSRTQAPLVVVAATGVALLTVVGVVTPVVLGAFPSGPSVAVDLAVGLMLVLVPLGVVAATARRHLRRSSLVDLAARIQEAPPDRLREVLADALDDPGLVVAFRARAAAGWVDADGRPVATPGPAAVPVVDDEDGPVALLVPGAGADHDPAILSGVRAAAGLTLSNAALRADLAARLADVRESRERIVLARDIERRRLERDLHDGAQQHLVAALLALGGDDAAAAAGHVRAGLAEIRRVARGLHPAILDAEGLGPALSALLESWPRPVTSHVDVDVPVPPPVAAVGYYVVAEALANATKHATGAPVCISAGVQSRDDGAVLVVEVRDEGPGGAATAAGGGLEGLADRCAALGGRLFVVSPAGHGTTVRAELPCAS